MKPKCLLALGVLLVGVTTAASLTAAQKPAPPPPTEQQKLKERLDALDSQLKEANAKADRAAMEKDYIERIQKEVNAYYEKAFNTQLATVTIIALIVGLIGKFGVDHIVQNKLIEASTTLREGFRKELADELQKLRDSNTAQLEQLEGALTKRIDQAEADLKLKSAFQFQFAEGLAFHSAESYEKSTNHFRTALAFYKSGKVRQVIEKKEAVVALTNVFRSLRLQDGDHYVENAKRELASDFYNDLEDELAQAGLRTAWLGPLVKERKEAAPLPVSESATTQAATSVTPPENAQSGTA